MNRGKWQVWQAKDGWRWRLKAANGRIVAESGEAYTRERDARRAMWNYPTVGIKADGWFK
jgi:uncharacterized protein YegP (UPF0339 family)